MNTYPRETIEFIPVQVTRDGAPIADFEIAITKQGERPTTWNTPDLLDDKRGALLNEPTPGIYRVWARVVGNPESVVVEAGSIRVS